MTLFLVSTPQIVSLEIAAKILTWEDHVEDLDRSKFKSKWPNCPGLLDLLLNYFPIHWLYKQIISS